MKVVKLRFLVDAQVDAWGDVSPEELDRSVSSFTSMLGSIGEGRAVGSVQGGSTNAYITQHQIRKPEDRGTERLIRRVLRQPHGCIHCEDGTDRLDSMSIMMWISQLLYLIDNLGNEHALSQMATNDEYPARDYNSEEEECSR